MILANAEPGSSKTKYKIKALNPVLLNGKQILETECDLFNLDSIQIECSKCHIPHYWKFVLDKAEMTRE